MPRRLMLREYEQSRHIAAEGYQFYALMAALMRGADSDNAALLRSCWPDIWESLQRRYNAPLGVVEEWDGFTPMEYHDRLEREREPKCSMCGGRADEPHNPFLPPLCTDCLDKAVAEQKRVGKICGICGQVRMLCCC